MRVNVILVFLSVVFPVVSAEAEVIIEFRPSFKAEGYQLWSNGPKRADWARRPDHGKNYWRELSAVVTALEPVSKGWLAGAVFGVPHADEKLNYNIACWGSDKCGPVIQTIGGVSDMSQILVNMFPLADTPLFLNMTYTLDHDFQDRYIMAMAHAYKTATREKFAKGDGDDFAYYKSSGVDILDETDNGSRFKAMAALEMFTGLRPEYKEKKDFSSAEDMSNWLDQSLLLGTSVKVISPTLVMSGGGLRPLGDKAGNAYALLDCRATPGSDNVLNQAPKDGDREAFDRSMNSDQLYAELEWLVRLKPEDAKLIHDVNGIRSKRATEYKGTYYKYFGIVTPLANTLG